MFLGSEEVSYVEPDKIAHKIIDKRHFLRYTDFS